MLECRNQHLTHLSVVDSISTAKTLEQWPLLPQAQGTLRSPRPPSDKGLINLGPAASQ